MRSTIRTLFAPVKMHKAVTDDHLSERKDQLILQRRAQVRRQDGRHRRVAESSSSCDFQRNNRGRQVAREGWRDINGRGSEILDAGCDKTCEPISPIRKRAQQANEGACSVHPVD
jgi:hypothetical protein